MTQSTIHSIHHLSNLSSQESPMQSPLDRDYVLTHTLEVPEIAPMPTIRSQRAATVAHWFGIDEQIHAATKAPLPARVLTKREARQAKQNARDDGALLR